MATLNATLQLESIVLKPALRQSDVATGYAVAPRRVTIGQDAPLAQAAAPGAIDVIAPAAVQATAYENSEQELFGKLIFTPTEVDLGYIPAETQITVSVWNTTRRNLRIDSIENTDSDSISVIDAGPGTVLPARSEATYNIVVNGDGKTRIDDSVAFMFEGMPVDAARVHIVGTRLVVFPVPPDWQAGIRDKVTRLSSLSTSYNGMEQRAKLREVPTRAYTFTVNALDDYEAAHLESLLYGWQARVFAVPLWQDASVLKSNVAKNATFVPVDTGDMEFKAGGFALLFKDQHACEAVEVASVTPEGLQLAYRTGSAWPAYATQVIPMAFGQLVDTVSSSHETSAMTEAELTFDIETV